MTSTNNRDLSLNMRRVKKLLNDVPDDRRPIAISMFEELVFMEQTLNDLKEQVRRDGAVNLFKQGRQEFLREHPALKGYNATISRYNNLYKELIKLLPPAEQETDTDALLNFVNGTE